MHELLKMVTQNGSCSVGSRGDAEEYKKEPKADFFCGALAAPLAIFWSFMVHIWAGVKA